VQENVCYFKREADQMLMWKTCWIFTLCMYYRYRDMFVVNPMEIFIFDITEF